MKIKTSKDFIDKYEDFAILLYGFDEDANYPERDDEYTIVNFAKFNSSTQIKRTIAQCKEILNLNAFPYKWIGNIANRSLCVMKRISPEANINLSDPDEQRYHKWVIWMVRRLEEEAKKQGKL